MNTNFKTLSCVHYTIFRVVKLNLFIRALLLDRILALKKKLRVRLAYILFMYANDTTLRCCLEDIKSDNKEQILNIELQRVYTHG